MPSTLREARDLFAGSQIAREAFGDEVVDHYVNAADVELTAFDAAVTDWERRPGVRTAVTRAPTRSSTRPPSRSVAQVELATVEETDAAIAARQVAGTGVAGSVARPTGGGCCAASPTRSTSTSEELARLEVANAGHTIGNARWEAGNVRDVLTYYAAAPERLFGRQIPVAGGIDVTFKEPLGVVGVIVPWNFPMPIAGWGFAPALAAGNAVVLKPAELTPLTAIRLGELALEAGLPEGVFTVCPGKGSVVGERFVTHAAVRKVCFTGSTAVGQRIMRGAADQVKRVTLELGGKSANIVFADSDLEPAAATAPYGGRSTTPGRTVAPAAGSSCERSVLRPLHGALEPAVHGRAWSTDPADEATEMGPLISAGQRETVRSFVEEADEPVDVAFRGEAPDRAGYWYPPTVVTAPRHERPGVARGGVRPGRRRSAVRRRGRRDRDGQRHRLRAVGLDLDP